MKRLLFMTGFIFICALSYAQYRTSAGRPVWLDGYFEDAPNSYVEVVSGTGYDEGNAREKALQMIVQRRNMSTGGRYGVSMQGDRIVVSGNDELTVKARVLDEFVEHPSPGIFRVSLLVQTAKHPDYPFEPVTVSDRYPASARALVPGMAQIYKGSMGKGITFIAGEVALVGGIVLSEAMRSSYYSKIATTHDANAIKIYSTYSSGWATARNICIAGAAALYVWNVVDGLVAKGKPRVEVGQASWAILPYADTRSAGMALAFNF